MPAKSLALISKLQQTEEEVLALKSSKSLWVVQKMKGAFTVLAKFNELIEQAEKNLMMRSRAYIKKTHMIYLLGKPIIWSA